MWRDRKGFRAGASGIAGVLACTALVACGGETKEDPGTTSTQSSGAPNGGRSSGAPDAGAATVRAASDRTADAGTARMVLRTQVTTQGRTVSLDSQGVIDLKDGTSTMTLAVDGEQIEQRIVDRILYQKLPPGAREGAPGNKPWIKVDVAGLRGGADLKKLVGPTLPMELWIDDRGRIRRQRTDMTMTPPKGRGADSSTPRKIASRTVLELSDFGTKVTVEPPPATETADMTDKVAQQNNQQG